MNESKTDPLSGLPQPNQDIKPSPLKDAGSLNEHGGERWWLKDSVQPTDKGYTHDSYPDAMPQPSSDTDDEAPISVAAEAGDEALTDADLTPAHNSSSEKLVPFSLIGVGLAALLLYLIFYGV